MDIDEAIKLRNSVRSFTDKKIGNEIENLLKQEINKCNEESGLNFQLFLNEPEAFKRGILNYGKIKNCKNYIALIGAKGMDEKYGYYGERLVLKVQQLGLNSCWIGLTYNKSKIPYIIEKGEAVRLVIALGYGETQGKPHKSKDMMKLCKVEGEMPAWFKNGMEAVVLAPTSINQQKFLFILKGNTVSAKALPAIYSKVDLGIVKCHFEIGAGKENFNWE